MEDTTNIASNVARAIVAAMDWTATPDSRNAAVSYLESIKSGDVRTLANISFLLVKRDWSSEIRLHGFKMLQHLVRLRWDELASPEKINFASTSINLTAEMVDPSEEWVLKSQTAALVAEVVRREGLHVWQDFVPSLTSMSSRGPVEAEMVAMILRWIPEDIAVHNEDLEGDRRRALLRGLTQSLPEILPLLYSLLEKHFGAALEDARNQNFDTAKQHANTVTALLNATNAYAGWAPVPDFARYGLIQGCGFLLSSIEFRLHACEFFRLLSQRKRPVDDSTSDFDSAMSNVFQILMNISRDFLHKSSSNAAGIDENEFEFAECVCESLVSLGSSTLHCIATENTMVSLFLQQMLGFFQHSKLAIHFQALLFWLGLMRGITSKVNCEQPSAGDNSANSSSSRQGDADKSVLIALVTDGICAAILDASFQRLLKKTAYFTGDLELWSEDFDGKSDFSQYRSRLLELIKLLALYKPVVAVMRLAERISSILEIYSKDAKSAQALVLLESMQLGLETIIHASLDGSLELVNSNSDVKFGLHKILEGLLQQFLSLKWTEPTLVVIAGRYLDAFGPFLKCFPDSVGGVINKLFELLTSLPFVLTDPSTNAARHARLQVCSSFIRIAKAADKSLLPHMKGIADTMAYLETEGRLLRGERNILAEAFLVMASSSGPQQQQEVLAWLLEPMGRQWTQTEWQTAFLSEPLGLTHLCSDAQFMWSIFHTVTFFEKALKRSGGIKKSNQNVQYTTSMVDASVPVNPMSSHLSWILPPLLKLLRCIHSLWSQPVVQALPLELRSAMSMSNVEQASLLGETISKPPKSAADWHQVEMNADGPVGSQENDLRNWLKGVRDSGYNVLGLSASIGDSFFQSMDSTSVALALMENVQSMEYRHIRQLVHLSIIPLVRFCPLDLREKWLESILLPLFLHCSQVLGSSWSSLLHEGRAKVPDIFGNLSELDLKREVMEEKLLRALTREMCQLLSVVASPALNHGIPSLEHLGNAQHIDVSSLKELDAFIANSLTCFLLLHKNMALPALKMTIEAFSWTDGEAVSKVASFSASVVLLAISTKNVELKEFVARDLFRAIIQSLTLESNVVISSDLVGLCREIFMFLADRDLAPRQVLLSIPGINNEDLLAFEDAIAKTSSPKEQKQHMKSLLLLATGNMFKALVAQRVTNVITNVSAKSRNSVSVAVPVIDDDVVGLAAIT